jgi:hypothetical protein
MCGVVSGSTSKTAWHAHCAVRLAPARTPPDDGSKLFGLYAVFALVAGLAV